MNRYNEPLNFNLKFCSKLYLKLYDMYRKNKNNFPDRSFNSFDSFVLYYFRAYIKKCYWHGNDYKFVFRSEQKMTEFLLKWS